MTRKNWLLGAAAITLLACGVDTELFSESGDSGAGASAGNGSAGSAGTPTAGGGGDPVDCNTPQDCPVPESACAVATCQESVCGVTVLPAGSECGPNMVCTDNGECASDLGAPCGSGDECASGFCADGVCCDQACDSGCAACDTGSCIPHQAATDPEGVCGEGVCDGSGNCAIGNVLWADASGNGGDDYFFRSAADNSGNVLVSGYFSSTLQVGPTLLDSNGFQDVVLAKLDANGNHVFAQSFGDFSGDFSWAIGSDDSGNIYLGGYFYGDISVGGQVHQSNGDRDIFLAKV